MAQDKRLIAIDEHKVVEVTDLPEEKIDFQRYGPIEKRRSDTGFLYFTVITVNMLSCVGGSSSVWLSPVLPMMLSNDTAVNPFEQPVSTTQISMLAGFPALSWLLGAGALPVLADIMGRKSCLQLSGAILTLSLIIVSFSSSITSAIVLKCITDFFLHGTVAVVQMFNIEITEDHNRAKFACFYTILFHFGLVFAFAVGPYLSYQNFTLIIAAPAVPCLLLFFYIPDTPIYLLSKGKDRETMAAIRKLRSNKTEKEMTDDFDKLVQTRIFREVVKPSLCDMFRRKQNRTGILLSILLLVVHLVAGVSTIMTFLAPFYNSAGTALSGNTVGIILGCLKFSAISLTSFVVEKIGKKKMILISTAGTGVTQFALAGFFYLKYVNSPWIPHLQWMPLTSMLCLIFIYSIGLAPLPAIVSWELFPSEYRALANIALVVVAGIVNFVLSFMFPIISAGAGVHWMVFLFSCSCGVGFLLLYFLIPETKGKTLQEIQEMLSKY